MILIANSGVLENVMFFVKWFEARITVCLNMNKNFETRNPCGVLLSETGVILALYGEVAEVM